MKQMYFAIFILLNLTSCGVNPKCSEIQDYEIVPSQGIGPYMLGMPESELKKILCLGYVKKEETTFFSNKKTNKYFLKNMSFICEHGKLKEIYVWGNFKGTFEDIDLDYEKEYLESYGDVIEHNGEYRILDIQHIAFGLENNENGKYIKIYR